MDVELIAITCYLLDPAPGAAGPESLIEHAGRVCYRSQARGDPAAFLRARLREGHESIVEHASATFEIGGISRACTHQLVRHRLASYSQESQRYVDMSDPELVVPDSIAENPEALEAWSDLVEHVKATYRELRAQGMRKEDARFALPNAAASRIVVTMNFREYLHFFRLRITPEAQWEIRRMALAMLEQLVPHSPTIFGDFLADVRARYPAFFEDA
jgi:thymidylate synthase (FAD)